MGDATHRCEIDMKAQPHRGDNEPSPFVIRDSLRAQRSEQQEWTVERLAAYIDREGRLNDKQLLSDINAALAAERQRREEVKGA